MSFRMMIIIILFGMLPNVIHSQSHEEGLASFYHQRFHGRKSASGTTHDVNEFVAAHKTLPFGTYLRVTNLANMRSAIVSVTDRGPYKKGRIIDVSSSVAEELGFKKSGIARVRVEIVPGREDLRWLEILEPRYSFADSTYMMPIPAYALTIGDD